MTIAHTENVANGVAIQPGKVLAYLGLNPDDPRSQAVVAVAQRYDLDPLLKHVIVIPKGATNAPILLTRTPYTATGRATSISTSATITAVTTTATTPAAAIATSGVPTEKS